MHYRQIRFFVVAGIALLLLTGTVAGQEQERETFQALARHTGTGPSGQSSIQINIDRWSSQEEHDHIVEVVMNEDNQTIADELRAQESVGFLRLTGRAAQGQSTGSWQFRWSREMQDGDTRIIRLATDRPVGFGEAVRRPARTSDSQTTLIELRVDENGEGQGVLMAGVEFSVDAKTNMLTLTHLSSSPVQLEQARRR